MEGAVSAEAGTRCTLVSSGGDGIDDRHHALASGGDVLNVFEN
jgi:hypothetical protein